MVGAVFLSEGLQKFITPEKTGVGRFTKIGLPYPDILGPFVGGVEILCGALVLFGLFTRFAVIPLIIIMLVALTTTKYPILRAEGFWAVAHAMRTDWSMLLGSIFLLIAGSGGFSIDERRSPRSR
jgi:uncharacterized membrane protein YphA (DoxX/SURF4 family)